ncbi:MAG: PAS domain S-box protein [Bacteroidota bacterium]
MKTPAQKFEEWLISTGKDKAGLKERHIKDLRKLFETSGLVSSCFEYLPLACIIINREGFVTEINSKANEEFGDISNSDLYDITAKEDFEELSSMLEELKVKGAAFETVLKIGPHDYHVLAVEADNKNKINIMVLFKLDNTIITKAIRKKNESGESPALESLITEIVQSKAAESRMRRAADNYSSFIERLPVGIYRRSSDGTLLMANPAAMEMIGMKELSEANMIKCQSKINKPGYDIQEFIENINDQNEVKAHVSKWKKPDGSYICIRETARAVRDEQSELLYIEGIMEDISEEVNSGKRPAKNIHILNKIMNSSSEALWEYFPENGYIELSHRYQEITGFSCDKKTTLKEAVTDIFQDEFREKVAGNLEKLLNKQKEFFETEGRITTADGNAKWVNLKAYYIKDEINGDSVIGNILNLNAKIENEKAVEYNEKKFRGLFEQSTDGIILISPDGKINDWNSSCSEMIGVNASDVINKSLDELSGMKRVKESGLLDFLLEQSSNFSDNKFKKLKGPREFTLYSADDSTRLIQAHSFIIMVEKSFQIGTVLRDITDLRNISEAYRILADQSIQGISIVSEGRIKYSNKAFLDISGYSADDVASMQWNDFIKIAHPDYRDSIDKRLKNILEGGKEKGENHLKIITKDKKEKWVEAFSILIEYKGKPAIQSIIMDITDRVNAELEKEKTLKSQLNAERKKNEAMRIIEESAKIASIGVVAGGITHEINQPLNAIKIGSDGLLLWNEKSKNSMPSSIIKIIKGISESSDRISEIISHMRSYWNESTPGSLLSIDLNEAVNNSVNLIQRRLDSHEITLIKQLFEKNIFIRGERVHLELMINNLINNSYNALKNINIKDKFIKLETYLKDDYAFFEINDNGPGIPEEDMNSIFDPFHSKMGLSGHDNLGLAIVKMFAERFGAKISSRNNLLGGACFTIRFQNLEH